MAYDEGLAQRIREYFHDQPGVAEKKMFGGLAFMLHGHMCCGIVHDQLMARVGPDNYVACLAREHASEMDFTGKSMKGLVYVAPEGIESESALHDWLLACVNFVQGLPPKATKKSNEV